MFNWFHSFLLVYYLYLHKYYENGKKIFEEKILHLYLKSILNNMFIEKII